MALIEANFFSEYLCRYAAVNIIFPDFSAERSKGCFHIENKIPVLYLLHGMGENHTSWCRYTNIERYAQQKRIAVVMPQMDNGYYCDLPEGGNYFQFYTEELPNILSGIFPIAADREHTFIAGAGTGGYGALLAGLRKSNQYSAIACISSRIEVGREDGKEKIAVPDKWRRMLFGDHMEHYLPENHEPSVILENNIKEQRRIPSIYIVCGNSDDRLYENRKFRKDTELVGASITYKEEIGGHNWEFWDLCIKDVLEWLPT